MADQLVAELKAIGGFSNGDIELFLSNLKEVFVPKGDDFLAEGRVSTRVGYVTSGLLMHYQIIDGIEIPCDFTPENRWVGHLKSFSTGTASDMSIKALEDTRLLALSSENLQELFRIQPKFVLIKNHYTELAFIATAEHTNRLVALSAKERYYAFMQQHPGLVNRVPQYYIAAYLGMKPQSLSRIRKGPS